MDYESEVRRRCSNLFFFFFFFFFLGGGGGFHNRLDSSNENSLAQTSWRRYEDYFLVRNLNPQKNLIIKEKGVNDTFTYKEEKLYPL